MTLRSYHHHEADATFDELGDGLVRVTDARGVSGVFRWNGPWVEGPLRDANLHMLIYTGGPNIPAEFNYRSNPIVFADINRPSGWPEKLERVLARNRES